MVLHLSESHPEIHFQLHLKTVEPTAIISPVYSILFSIDKTIVLIEGRLYEVEVNRGLKCLLHIIWIINSVLFRR